MNLQILLCLSLLSGLLFAVRRWQVRLNPHPEFARKTMHVGVGLIAMCFPTLFGFGNWTPVAVVSAVAIVVMILLRVLPGAKRDIGSVLASVRRPGFGEIYFLLSLVVLMWLAKSPAEYFLSLSVLTFADSAGALVGAFYGRVRFGSPGREKSLEGTVTFFLVALAINMFFFHAAFSVAMFVAFVASYVEAVSVDGQDNLWIPLSLLVVLNAPLLSAEVQALNLGFIILTTFVLLSFTGWETATRLRVYVVMSGLFIFWLHLNQTSAVVLLLAILANRAWTTGGKNGVG